MNFENATPNTFTIQQFEFTNEEYTIIKIFASIISDLYIFKKSLL